MQACVRVVGLAILLAACGSDTAEEVCVIPPCIQSTALSFTITSASSSVPLPAGVFVNATAPFDGPAGCLQTGTTTTCYLHGDPGMYQVQIGAPGFQSVARTVNVGSQPPVKCGCGGAETVHLDIALVPAA